jgi:hypothetical protein
MCGRLLLLRVRLQARHFDVLKMQYIYSADIHLYIYLVYLLYRYTSIYLSIRARVVLTFENLLRICFGRWRGYMK